MKDVVKYWLNLGIDRYRFDAVGNLIENGKDKELRKIFNQYTNIFTVAESFEGAAYMRGDGFHSSFSFKYQFISALKSENLTKLNNWLSYLGSQYPAKFSILQSIMILLQD